MGYQLVSQIAVSNQHYVRHTLHSFFEAIAKQDIANLELWAGYPHCYVHDMTASQINRLRSDIENRNLRLICFTPEQNIYPINIAAEETEIRRRSQHYMLRALEVACELGAPMVQIAAGWHYLNHSHAEAWKRSQESLQLLLQRSEQLGLTLALEHTRRKESNVVSSPRLLKQMLQEIQSPFLKGVINPDTTADNVASLRNGFIELEADVYHIHLLDLHKPDCAAYVRQYLEEIRNYRYERYITLELTDPLTFLDPDRALEQFLHPFQSIES